MRTIETMQGETRLTGRHDDYGRPISYTSSLALEVIHIARDRGCPSLQVDDWSFLRDAPPDGQRANLESALNWLRDGR